MALTIMTKRESCSGSGDCMWCEADVVVTLTPLQVIKNRWGWSHGGPERAARMLTQGLTEDDFNVVFIV